jgi:mannose-6-phosphate isomerase-like protein (cupin superfamily)
MTNRRTFLSAVTAQTAALGAEHKSLPNKAMSAEEARGSQFPQGLARLYLNGPTNQLSDLATGSWLVKAGMSPHDIHQHPEEELLIFVEGTGKIVIAGVSQPVKQGSVMYCAANVPHGVFNSQTSDMLFYFVKWRA